LPEEARGDLQELLSVAKGEVERLDSIVQQFLGAIRPAHLQVGLENINALICESVRFLEPEIKDRDVEVEQRLRMDIPLAEVDSTQIKQAFFNIIKNAVQAMRRGGVLRIETELENHFIRITFLDTGGGISPANMSKIFEPYFTTKQSGSGLGLLIVRRIVREHGGEIDLVSHDGQGLEFTVRLPLRDQRARLLPPSE
ncbi:MAG: ATP-binding protein, partial [Verrucomicrobiota bacterium]